MTDGTIHHSGYLSTTRLLDRVVVRGRRYRRRRLAIFSGTLGSAIALATSLALVLVLGGPSTAIYAEAHIGLAVELTAAAQPPSSQVVSADQSASVAAEERFALRLLALSSEAAPGSNEVLSPASLDTVLMMLSLGARAATASSIETTLQSDGLPISRLAAGWSGAVSSLMTHDHADLRSVNSLWTQSSFPLKASFVHALSNYFSTGIWKVDFATHPGRAISAMNAWVRSETDGQISNLFSPSWINTATRLAIANATTFDAHWLTSFTGGIHPGSFQLAGGGTVAVPFMLSTPKGSTSHLMTASVVETSKYTAVELPYANKELDAVIMMPTSESLSSFAQRIVPSTVADVANAPSSSVLLNMPTFTLRSQKDLSGTLSRMGMGNVFSSAADFSGITTAARMQVNRVQQDTVIAVMPKGTQAATGTGAGTGPIALIRRAITIDRPFVMFVRDRATGAILFETVVTHP